ncbi:MAG: glycosyltransferase family 4 protein [Nevskiales bacterium]
MNLARGYRGGERQTELLIQALAERGVIQTLVMRRGSSMAGNLRGLRNLELVEIGRPFIRHMAALRGAELVHAHEARAGQLAFCARLCGGTGYVITRHVHAAPSGSLLNRALYRNARAVFAASRHIGEVLQARFPRLPASVVPEAHANLPRNDEQVSVLRRRFAGKFVVGHAGALVNRHKGQLYLIEAVRQLRQRCPDLQLVLLGAGKDEAMLRASARGLDNVLFAGFQHNVGDWFAALDAFAFPSLHEGLGSVLLDAMQAGLPIVASAVGGIPEIVEHEVNGLLVPPRDAGALAQAMLRLYQEPALRDRFSAAGRVTAQRYSPADMTDSYLQHYRLLLQDA